MSKCPFHIFVLSIGIQWDSPSAPKLRCWHRHRLAGSTWIYSNFPAELDVFSPVTWEKPRRNPWKASWQWRHFRRGNSPENLDGETLLQTRDSHRLSAAQLGLKNKLNSKNISICDKYVRDNSEKNVCRIIPRHLLCFTTAMWWENLGKSGKMIWLMLLEVRKMKNIHCWTFEKHLPRHVICHNFAPGTTRNLSLGCGTWGRV